MRYWLICLRRPDIEHCVRIGTYGLKRKLIIGRVKKGDKLVVCATRDWTILGLGELTSDYYNSDEPVFLERSDAFIDRFNFAVTNFESFGKVLKEVVEDLSFVSDLAYWSVYFRNGIVELRESDWKRISSLFPDAKDRL
jgi:hypothetical protein